MKLCFLIAALCSTVISTSATEAPLQNFITARGDQLLDGDQPFRFISFDIPNLQLIEDNVPFTGTNPWRLPDQFELTDALATMREMGGTVVRTYVISVIRPDDLPGTPRHVLGPGKFNEEAFRELDLAIKTANEQGIRLIIPLVDNWVWQGGRAEYAGFRGKTKDDFWTDPQLIADFEQTVQFILTRTNTYTGVRYADDRAILCWETGNELASPPSWTREIAAYIKGLDTNHLVMDGFNTSVLRPESLAMTNVDIVTTHHYPHPGMKKTFAELIRANREMAKGKKPYIVGEFGFMPTAKMDDAMKAIMDSDTSGGLLWSLRFRDRDGGFYWHSEPGLGGNLYKAFHWPASTIGDAYDEINLMAIVRTNAFAIRGMAVPPVPVPAPPQLLPITDAAAISWQGSVGAKNYQVERSAEENLNLNLPFGGGRPIGGNWQIVSSNVDEAFTQYRPQFADENVPAGRWYYRVRARNDAGLSEPSNVVGPVAVTHATLVDELADFTKTSAHSGTIRLETHDSRQAKEDATRAAGNAGDSLTYHLPTAIESFRVFAFFPKDVADLKFFISSDGQNFQAVKADRQDYFQGAGDYGYWKSAIFHAEDIKGDTKFLKIGLTGETQIGRVEITHAPDKN
jgi:mannan endo-1,4-beta-mannosidase